MVHALFTQRTRIAQTALDFVSKNGRGQHRLAVCADRFADRTLYRFQRVDTPDGYAIYVGRSAGQNEQVTFKIGAADDVWLHARGMPGAHVLIKSAGREVPEPTLRRAAELAAYYSKGRGESAVEIDIARRSQVRRIPNAPAGLVSYHAERTIRAAPRASNEPLP